MKQMLIILPLIFFISACCSLNNDRTIKKAAWASDPAMKLKASIKIEDQNDVLFRLEATRMKESEDEYIPSSEDLRIEIISLKGKPVWNSNHNKSFLQVIGTVKPEKAGESHIYEMRWNGLSNSRKKLPAGKYTVRMTIPARPKAYTTTTNLDWKAGND